MQAIAVTLTVQVMLTPVVLYWDIYKKYPLKKNTFLQNNTCVNASILNSWKAMDKQF